MARIIKPSGASWTIRPKNKSFTHQELYVHLGDYDVLELLSDDMMLISKEKIGKNITASLIAHKDIQSVVLIVSPGELD